MDPIFEMNEASRVMCETLMTAPQEIPRDSLLSDGIFESTCEAIAGKNEHRLVHYIMSLIVAPAEELHLREATDLRHLADTYNERWNRITPFTDRHPQPTYSVGFSLNAFSADHLGKMNMW